MSSRKLDTFSIELSSSTSTPVVDDDYRPVSLRKWYHNIPLAVTVFLILAPQPSVLYVLVNYHWRLLHSPILFATHLTTIYGLTFLTFSSLIVCIARDPGPVVVKDASMPNNDNDSDDENEDSEMGLTQALMGDGFSLPGRWCRSCWAPKPERAHHCSTCGRCVSKQDHHCPWLGSRCIGHRTYPAFIHFIASITLLSCYVAGVSISALMFALDHSSTIDATTPLHEIFLALYSLIFAVVMGSFLAYHLYLVTTNQTTIEHLNPFLLLRHLPPLPRTEQPHRLSDPPVEHELSYAQRRMVRDAHGQIRVYDVGWRKNWAQVFGWKRPATFLYRLWLGGASTGSATRFPRNTLSERQLGRLAEELVKLEKDR